METNNEKHDFNYWYKRAKEYEDHQLLKQLAEIVAESVLWDTPQKKKEREVMESWFKKRPKKKS